MRISINYGIALGVIVAALGFILATTGLHTKHPTPTGFVLAAILINIVMVVLALQQTAHTANWSRQVLSSLFEHLSTSQADDAADQESPPPIESQ